MRLSALAALAATLLAVHAAGAQERRGAVAGAFDFWVLSLSWSPAYCASGVRSDPWQCARGRDLGFVVHGLWPQYERGFPSFCAAQDVPASAGTIRSILDVIPSQGLARHQWRKHGSCSGLGPAGYFAAVRRAAAAVRLPDAFDDGVDAPRRLSADAVANAFIAANPGLRRDMLSVQCDGGALSEVRLCLSGNFRFRSCPDVARRSCRRPALDVPAAPGR